MNTLSLYNDRNWLPRKNGNPAYMEHINDLIKKINEIITEDAADNASLAGDNVFAGSNTFSENIQFAEGAYGVTALAGGGQVGATPLTGMVNTVAVCATNGDSCILPEALAGNLMIVSVSEVAVGRPQIFPAVGEQIDTMGVNVPLTVTPGTVVMFSCDADGNWVSTSLYDINHIYNAINTAKVEVKPYDVYVALLNQTNIVTTSGLLVVGKTYLIESLQAGDDFTNVGYTFAGTPFVATDTTPTVWANSTSVINCTDSIPVATILENTLGEVPTFSYLNTGTYLLNATTAFNETKTVIIVGQSLSTVNLNKVHAYTDNDYITINTKDITNANIDNVLINTPIEIRVYP